MTTRIGTSLGLLAWIARLWTGACRRLKKVIRRSALVQGLIAMLAGMARSLSVRAAGAVTVRAYGFFDEEFYASQVFGHLWRLHDPVSHYLSVGAARGYDPHPLFDSRYYLDHNPDLEHTRTNPLLHFLEAGAAAKRHPHPCFEENPTVVDGLLDRFPRYGRRFWKKYPRARRWYDAKKPRVSIIVTSFHESALTARCLERVWLHTEGASYEVIVIGNGSAWSDIAAVARRLYAGRLIALHFNPGLGEGRNIASELARGEHLFFLSNDACVTENWLKPLLEVTESHPDAGLVGAKLVDPDGRLQQAGSVILESGTIVRIGESDDVLKPNYNIVRAVDFCSVTALLVTKALFERCRGFDRRFGPHGYEDADLGLKARELGYKSYYCPTSVVAHEVLAPSARPGQSDPRHRTLLEANKHTFLQKWQPHLRRASYSSLSSTPSVSGSSGIPRTGVREFVTGVDWEARQRVGLFTPHGGVPRSGERYILSIAEMFGECERDCLVDLVMPHRYSRFRVASVAGALGLDVARLRLRTLEEVRSDPRYDVFIAIGSEVVPPVEGLGTRNLYICEFPWSGFTERYEQRVASFAAYDAVVVYSDFCAEHFVKASDAAGLGPLPVETVHPPVAMMRGEVNDKDRVILSVGRFFAGEPSKKQHEMVRVFKKMCDDGLDGWELHLAGAVHEEPEHREFFMGVIEEACGCPVTIHGNPSFEELIALYRRASIYWHATGVDEDITRYPERHERFGIATVEAMSAGVVPVVFGTGGSCEIIEDGSSGFLWRTVEELRKKTIALIQIHEEQALDPLRRNARSRAVSFDVGRFRSRIAEVLQIDRPSRQTMEF